MQHSCKEAAWTLCRGPPTVLLRQSGKGSIQLADMAQDATLLSCSALGLLASSSKKFGRLSGYADRIVEAEQAAKQIALDTSRERWCLPCVPHPDGLQIRHPRSSLGHEPRGIRLSPDKLLTLELAACSTA